MHLPINNLSKMGSFKSIIPALDGSMVLNRIHELARRKLNNMPRINEIAEEGCRESMASHRQQAA
jgi:hypothetical protein